MSQSTYHNKLKEFARQNRKEGTKGEAILWKFVLSRKQTGYQFNRQFVLGNYIVDFICRKLNLIIEVDGSSHSFKTKDGERQIELERLGYTILRFEEYQVVKKLEDVISAIEYTILTLEEKSQQYRSF